MNLYALISHCYAIFIRFYHSYSNCSELHYNTAKRDVYIHQITISICTNEMAITQYNQDEVIPITDLWDRCMKHSMNFNAIIKSDRTFYLQMNIFLNSLKICLKIWDYLKFLNIYEPQRALHFHLIVYYSVLSDWGCLLRFN